MPGTFQVGNGRQFDTLVPECDTVGNGNLVPFAPNNVPIGAVSGASPDDYSAGFMDLMKRNWGGKIDAGTQAPPPIDLDGMLYGQKITTSPAYRAANPPPYQNRATSPLFFSSFTSLWGV